MTHETKGYLAIILHAHLPFVRHPENRHHLEELWLFEALTDTYLPLLDVMRGWLRDDVPFHLTMSVTPPLASMLADPLLQTRYVEHLDRSVALAQHEVEKHRHTPHLRSLAEMYQGRFEWARRTYVNELDRDVLGAWRRLLPHGLELMASAATHGFLPLMEPIRSAARAQIRAGVEHHRATFGDAPKGFWLPECAYHPDHADLLTEEGIRYTVVDTHGVMHGVPRPRYAVYSPVYTAGGAAVFGRDVETSKQVWSSDEGYPGDFDYREFYRDVGHDLPWAEISPFLPWGVRADTGIKYYRITGKSNHKELYDPSRAAAKAREHAANFVFNRRRQIDYLAGNMDREPIVVAPYDAELFGHWWFEGPIFLDHVVRMISRDPAACSLITPAEYLDQYPTHQVVEVSASTWGYKGYNEVWLEDSNDWIYRHLHAASRRMETLATRYPAAEGELKRALNQAARELMLAQSSDWAFIMKTGTVVEYAVRRTREHLANFITLADQLTVGAVDRSFLEYLEREDNLLPHLDYRVYLPASVEARSPVGLA